MKPTTGQIKGAFRESIERWEKITEDLGYYDKTNCSLCNLGKDDKYDYDCNEYCPIRDYGTGNHAICCNTPYDTFHMNRTKENALAELNFLREVYIDYLEEGEKDVCCKEEEEKKKEEWVNVTKELTAEVDMISDKQGYLALSHNGLFMAYTSSRGEIEGLRLVSSHINYRIEAKGGDFSVFKRNSSEN